MYKKVILFKKRLGKLFRGDNNIEKSMRVISVREVDGFIYMYYHKYSDTIDYTLQNMTSKIAVINKILKIDDDGNEYTMPNQINPYSISSGILYLLERCSYSEVWLPIVDYDGVFDITGNCHYSVVYNHNRVSFHRK